MKKLGHVKAILNDQLLLVSSDASLEQGEIIKVFAEITDPRIAEAAGIEVVAYPKGELRIVCSQDKGVYLVERFREVEERKRTITTPSSFQKALLGFAAQLQPETKEIVEEVAGPWSAELDDVVALGIKFDRTVHVGDPIGRL